MAELVEVDICCREETQVQLAGKTKLFHIVLFSNAPFAKLVNQIFYEAFLEVLRGGGGPGS